MKLDIRPGQKYNMLTVIGEGERKRQPNKCVRRYMLCRCDCGNEKEIGLAHLVRGKIKSCGCISPEKQYHNKRLENTWRGMKNRAYFNTHSQPQYYKDKEIGFYLGWLRYNDFAEWALQNGWDETKTIDRIDGNKGYYPTNCRFVTQQVNNLNRSVTYKVWYAGLESPLLSILIDQKKQNHYQAIKSRIGRGWDIDKAINTPIRTGNYRRNTQNNETH